MASSRPMRDPVDKRGWMAPEERQPRCFSSLHTWEQGRSNKPRIVQDDQAGNHLSSGSPALPCLRLRSYRGSPKLGRELSHFSGFAIRHHGQGSGQKEGLFGLFIQRDKNLSWRGSMVAGRCDVWSWMLRAHILKCKHETEKELRKLLGSEHQTPPPVTLLVARPHLPTLTKQCHQLVAKYPK